MEKDSMKLLEFLCMSLFFSDCLLWCSCVYYFSSHFHVLFDIDTAKDKLLFNKDGNKEKKRMD